MGASAGAIKGGEAYVVLGMDMSPYQASLRTARDQLQQFGRGVAAAGAAVSGVGAAITAPFAYGLTVFQEVGQEIHDVAQAMGISGTRAAEVMAAMGGSGADLTAFANKMASFVADVARGTPSAVAALRELGLSAEELTSVAPDEQLMRIVDALSRVGNISQRMDLARTIGGRGAGAYAERLAGGRIGLEQRIAGRRAAGTLMEGDDSNLANELGKSYKGLSGAMKAFWTQVGAAAAPTVIAINRTMTGLVASVVRWTSANRPLLTTIFQIGSVLTTVGAAIATIGGSIYAIGTGFGIAAQVGTYLATAMAFLANPLVALTIGLAAAAAAVIYFSGSGNALMGFAAGFGQTFMSTLTGIQQAIASGNWALAAEVALAGVAVVWARIGGELDAISIGVVQEFIGYWRDFGGFWIGFWFGIVNWLSTKLVGASVTIAQAFVSAFTAVKGAIIDAMRNGELAWVRFQGRINPLQSQAETDRRLAETNLRYDGMRSTNDVEGQRWQEQVAQNGQRFLGRMLDRSTADEQAVRDAILPGPNLTNNDAIPQAQRDAMAAERAAQERLRERLAEAEYADLERRMGTATWTRDVTTRAPDFAGTNGPRSSAAGTFSASSIVGFLGGAGRSLERTAQDQLETQQQMAATLRAIEQNAMMRW